LVRVYIVAASVLSELTKSIIIIIGKDDLKKDPSLSQILYNPPSWCKIKTQAWRFRYGKKKNYSSTKRTTEKIIRMVAYDFGVGQFFSGAMGQLYPGGDTLYILGEYRFK